MRVTNELRLLAMIDRAAQSGAPPPRNEQICETLGFPSTASAGRLVALAVEHGSIVAEYPSHKRRLLTLTAEGRRRVAAVEAARLTEPVPPRRGPDERLRNGRPVDVSHLPPIGDDGAVRLARSAAESANNRFLAAMARLAPVPDAIDRDGGRFNRLPPPTLTGQSFS